MSRVTNRGLIIVGTEPLRHQITPIVDRGRKAQFLNKTFITVPIFLKNVIRSLSNSINDDVY